MQTKWVLSLAAAAAFVGVGIYFESTRSAGLAVAEDAAKPTFIGPESCKKCHFKQYGSWKKTGMATNLEKLKPGEAAEKKTAAGLDLKVDYSKDPKCLVCHATGYGTETGYPAIVEGKAWTPAEEERAKTFGMVACEACHGAGSLFAPYKKDHQEYKLADIQALGATAPCKVEQCMVCHKKECPTMPKDYAWDFEKAKKSAKDLHEHIPMKFTH